MNSLTNREWELYNYGGASSEYDNALINKDIDNYFNELVSKPIPPTSQHALKSTYGFDKFYTDYIEHNLIFIVVLVGIIIFLFIRYYVKDFDIPDDTNENFSTEKQKQSDNSTNSDSDSEKKRIDILKKKHARKLQIERLKIAKYKQELDNEKQKILSIIDELSNMNEYEYAKSQTPIYLNGPDIYEDGFGYNKAYQQAPYLNQNNTRYYNQTNDSSKTNLDSGSDKYITDAHNTEDNSQYLNINKPVDNKTNEIEGLYIEPPFM